MQLSSGGMAIPGLPQKLANRERIRLFFSCIGFGKSSMLDRARIARVRITQPWKRAFVKLYNLTKRLAHLNPQTFK